MGVGLDSAKRAKVYAQHVPAHSEDVSLQIPRIHSTNLSVSKYSGGASVQGRITREMGNAPKHRWGGKDLDIDAQLLEVVRVVSGVEITQ